MNGATHVAGGVLAGAVVGAGIAPLPIAIAGLAALVPDWLQVNIPGASRLVHGVFGHRGISHWFITAGLVAFLVRFISRDLAVYALAGWGSHIVLDLFSDGVPALWPLPRITLAHVKTGSWMDAIIGGALLVLSVSIIVGRLM